MTRRRLVAMLSPLLAVAVSATLLLVPALPSSSTPAIGPLVGSWQIDAGRTIEFSASWNPSGYWVYRGRSMTAFNLYGCTQAATWLYQATGEGIAYTGTAGARFPYNGGPACAGASHPATFALSQGSGEILLVISTVGYGDIQLHRPGSLSTSTSAPATTSQPTAAPTTSAPAPAPSASTPSSSPSVTPAFNLSLRLGSRTAKVGSKVKMTIFVWPRNPALGRTVTVQARRGSGAWRAIGSVTLGTAGPSQRAAQWVGTVRATVSGVTYYRARVNVAGARWSGARSIAWHR